MVGRSVDRTDGRMDRRRASWWISVRSDCPQHGHADGRTDNTRAWRSDTRTVVRRIGRIVGRMDERMIRRRASRSIVPMICRTYGLTDSRTNESMCVTVGHTDGSTNGPIDERTIAPPPLPSISPRPPFSPSNSIRTVKLQSPLNLTPLLLLPPKLQTQRNLSRTQNHDKSTKFYSSLNLPPPRSQHPPYIAPLDRWHRQSWDGIKLSPSPLPLQWEKSEEGGEETSPSPVPCIPAKHRGPLVDVLWSHSVFRCFARRSSWTKNKNEIVTRYDKTAHFPLNHFWTARHLLSSWHGLNIRRQAARVTQAFTCLLPDEENLLSLERDFCHVTGWCVTASVLTASRSTWIDVDSVFSVVTVDQSVVVSSYLSVSRVADSRSDSRIALVR